MTTVGFHSGAELSESDGEGGPSDEETDPSKPARLECRAGSHPNGVWFGLKGSEATERELIAFLGSHNGVARTSVAP